MDSVTCCYKCDMEFEDVKKKLTDALAGRSDFVIGYHPDADGIAGTALLIKHLKKQGVTGQGVELYPINSLHRSFNEVHLNRIMSRAHDAIIYIDCAISDHEQISSVAGRFNPVICIDHHNYKKGLEKIPHLYINSIDFNGLTRPDLLAISKMLNSLFYDPANDWMELVGLEGDIVTQSVIGSPVYEAARRLNALGLIEEYGVPLDIETARKNRLVDLTEGAENIYDFLEKIDAEKGLAELFDAIIKDINCNLEILETAGPTHFLGDNKIYIHEIVTQRRFDISEHILKAHIKHLEYNETFIIYYLWGDGITLRIYTSNSKIDCEKIARMFGGGGHKRRAGITNLGLDSPAGGVISKIVDEVKKMAGAND